MSDNDETTGDRTATDGDDVSRREVLEKSSAGAGFVLWQSGWWGSGGSDSGTSGGGWLGSDGGSGGGGWWGDDGSGATGGGGDPDPERPIVFVHGGAGSALEFESQAMRFESNGYPADYLAAFEYNSTAYGSSLIGGGLGSGGLGDGGLTGGSGGLGGGGLTGGDSGGDGWLGGGSSGGSTDGLLGSGLALGQIGSGSSGGWFGGGSSGSGSGSGSSGGWTGSGSGGSGTASGGSGGSGTGGDSGVTPEEVHAALDQKIDDLLAETGADQVYAIGHSLGTAVLGSYLSQPDRAAKVAKYVDLDGRAHDSLPGGVETLAVWGLGSTDSTISGAENVHFDSKSHVQVATSADTFAEVYEFLLGEAPDTTSIEVEPADQVTLSGRTQLFPENNAPSDLFGGASLAVYEIDPATGQPTTSEPVAEPSLDAEGRWGPIDVDGSAYHEFRLSPQSTDQVHHFYRQPELRSNQFVRLHTTRPGEGTDQFVDRSDNHTVMTVLRPKEWWGDQGANNDSLTVDGTNVVNATTAPQAQRVISPFIFDAGTDQQSDLSTQPSPFPSIPFLGGVDYYVPAASPPDATVEVTETPRNGAGLTRSFAVPNWQSTGHRVSLYVPDHTQTR